MLTYICNSCGKEISKFEGVFVTLKEGLVANEYILCYQCADALKKDLTKSRRQSNKKED